MGLFKQLAALEKSMSKVADDVRALALQVEYHRGYTAGQLDAIAKLAQRLPQTDSQQGRSQNATPVKSNQRKGK